MMGIKLVLLQLSKFFLSKSSGTNTSGCADTRTNKSDIKSEIIPNQRPSDLALQQLLEELQESIIRKFEKQKRQHLGCGFSSYAFMK